ncbi:zinc-ribbon domain-containing protein [Roseiconus nitratireducens]|uniref:Zinc-ribbon domain-containing protein n=1 Tax=Roseiconus nitratireducens TaxID=2605748 RepID=A0A5M6D561_9BACT|nr:zinc ribbon domain-containing protein [Roseiconus nitratireducens]KAA5542631.1 zinc-ribbon domain-containing protein [Roseiconus nitratireducens]
MTENSSSPLNHVRCPGCGYEVDDRAVACPRCGEKIYVEHPGDITPTRHPPVSYPGRSDASPKGQAPTNQRPKDQH